MRCGALSLGLFLATMVTLFASTEYASAQSDSTFEIREQYVSIALYPSAGNFACNDTLVVHRDDLSQKALALLFNPALRIQKLAVNNRSLEPKRREPYLVIDHLPDDSVVTITIAYTGQPSYRSEFFHISTDRAVMREEEFLPTGRRVFRQLRVSLSVPRGWKTLAAGSLVGIDSSDTGVATYVWASDQALSGLGWICAGLFNVVSDSSGKIPISIYRFEDSSKVTEVLPTTRKALEYYSRIFSPFRFPKLDIVEIDDWIAGRNILAIAAPSFIMVKQLAFTTPDRYNQIDVILPHEIAHQWWPMTVFSDESDAAFLSEGMCEYSSILFHQSIQQFTPRDSLSKHPLLRPLLQRAQAGEDAALEGKTDLRTRPTHYVKAAYVHTMLRTLLGDTLFFRLYASYARLYATRQATLEGFAHLADSLAGKDLAWFFDQWVRRSGIPRLRLYNVKSLKSGKGWLTQGRVRLVGYEKFTTPVDVGVHLPTETKKTRVWIGRDSSGAFRNDLPFELLSSTKPDRAVLDPGGDLLKLQKMPPRCSDTREPGRAVMIVGSTRDEGYLKSLALHDSASLDPAGWTITIKTDAEATLADLQRERVILYGSREENRTVLELEKHFPISFQKDSVVLPSRTMVFDSTLAILQAIDNPYMTPGLMIWVAPMSTRALPELLPYDHSWVLLKGKDEIASGDWEVTDEELSVSIP